MAEKKNGLGKGLASLIPSGPTKPRLGESAADIVLGPRRNADSEPPTTKALGKGGESAAWYASNDGRQPHRPVSVGQSRREAAGATGSTSSGDAPARRGGLGGRRRGGVASVIGGGAASAENTAATSENRPSDEGNPQSRASQATQQGSAKKGARQGTEAGAAGKIGTSDTNTTGGSGEAETSASCANARSASSPQSGAGEAAADMPLVSPLTATYGEIPISNIRRNPHNPRVEFDLEALEELAHSIREFGLLQPIVVREVQPGDTDTPLSDAPATADTTADPLNNPLARYELIMGERRLRASIMAGLTEIPAIVRQTDNDNMLRDALLENIHRVQLNPLEEGAAYQQLLDDFGVTQEELAKRLGRSRPVIANTIRLLQLPAAVRRRVAAGVLSAGHARALLGLKVGDDTTKVTLAERIVREGLSVRATEEAVTLLNRDGQPDPNKKERQPRIQPERMTAWATDFGDFLDTSVKVQMGAKKGKIVVEFAGEDDFDRIVEIFRSLPRSA
ncbi:MAG: ParB/RepB/Spo0J family partition protein [Bifidobacterium sp.]|nr:ParB/RepB/Spo0J family partition protein [Bifidobacterium sp.]